MMPGATMNTGLKSLKECFGELRDPRIMGRTTHALLDILVLTICAVIAGAHDWEYVELWGGGEDRFFAAIRTARKWYSLA